MYFQLRQCAVAVFGPPATFSAAAPKGFMACLLRLTLQLAPQSFQAATSGRIDGPMRTQKLIWPELWRAAMHDNTSDNVLQGYATASADLIVRYEEVLPLELYAPVIELLPSSPARIVDIGAGTGRDAAWLAAQGHDLVAVEPVDEFRHAGMALHKSNKIAWLNDRLPHLSQLRERKQRFDRVLLTAVWHHLHDPQRCAALPILAELTAPDEMLIMSLRHGPGASGRQVYPVHPEHTIREASRTGFRLAKEYHATSKQAKNRDAGVYWTWLAFGFL